MLCASLAAAAVMAGIAVEPIVAPAV